MLESAADYRGWGRAYGGGRSWGALWATRWLCAVVVMWMVLAGGARWAQAGMVLESKAVGPRGVVVPEGAVVVGVSDGVLVVGGKEGGTWSGRVVVVGASGVREAETAVRRAGAASVAEGGRVIVVGGVGPDGASAAVTSIDVGTLAATELPVLPEAAAAPGAAVLGGKLYVLANTALFSLDLQTPGAVWERAAAFPGPPRTRALLAGQNNGLYLLGGVIDGRTTDEAWMFLPKPREASTASGWQRLPAMPVAGAAGAVMTSGQQAVVLALDRGDGSTPVGKLFNVVTLGWADADLGSKPGTLHSGGDRLIRISGDTVGELRPTRSSRSLGWADYLVIAVYFLAMGGIGVAFSAKQTSTEAFSLGGRDVKWWAAGLSMFATAVSSISFIAIPALSFGTNLVFMTPLIVMIPAFFIQGWVIFPLLARMRITSTFEYLERRFNSPLRLIASGQAVLFQTVGRTGVVLLLPSIALSATTGLDVITCVVVMGLVTTIYTAVGGFEAVVWTDVLQGLLMFVAPFLVIVLVLFSIPGDLGSAMTLLAENDKTRLALPTWDLTLPALWLLLLGGLLGHTVALAGDQPVIQRVFSTPLKTIRKTSAMYIASGLLIGVLVNLMGLALFLYFHHFPDRIDATASKDQVVPYFLVTALPTGVAGLLIAAIFAAAMSTVSSSMNSVATLIHVDFYKRIWPDVPEARQLKFLKRSSYVIGLVGTGFACLIATFEVDSMMVTWNMLAGLLGGGVVGVYSLGMFSTRANSTGAISGAVASMVFSVYANRFTDLHWSTYAPGALLTCIIVGYVVSLLTGGNRKDLTGLTAFTPARDTATPADVPAPEAVRI